MVTASLDPSTLKGLGEEILCPRYHESVDHALVEMAANL
jgi:hypothetical protein